MLKQRQDAYCLVSDDILSFVKESNVKKGGMDIISASADGGPRSRVGARGTLRSAPHRH